MSDIVERLRAEGSDAFRKHYSMGMWSMCAEAAIEIERLRAALKECAKASYLDEHDLMFMPTREALIAREALRNGQSDKEDSAEIKRLRGVLKEIEYLARASIDDQDGCDWLPQIERAAQKALGTYEQEGRKVLWDSPQNCSETDPNEETGGAK